MNRVCHILILGLLLVSSTVLAQFADADILFMSDRDGNREIYVMNADGSIVRRLTNHPAEDTDPTWSPNRQQIAFASNRDGEFSVYIMNADGSNISRLSPDLGSYAGSPAWSPDGRSIAYVSNAEGKSQIHVMAADGSDDRAITDGSHENIDPTWSPDGILIAFAANPNGNFEIFVVTLGGTELRQLTNDSNSDSDSPTWSPDGTLIAFASNRAQLGELYVMNTRGNDLRGLLSTENQFISSPAWSPDGRSIVYSVRGSIQTTLQRIEVDGSGLVQIDSGIGNADFASWSVPELTAIANPTPQQIANQMLRGVTEENCRVWTHPDVSVGAVVTTIPPSTVVYIVAGPIEGLIRYDNNSRGNWYQVALSPNDAPLGWVWEQRLNLQQ